MLLYTNFHFELRLADILQVVDLHLVQLLLPAQLAGDALDCLVTVPQQHHVRTSAKINICCQVQEPTNHAEKLALLS
jgi:hypothetical protein